MKPVGLREVKAEERGRRRETIGCGHPGKGIVEGRGRSVTTTKPKLCDCCCFTLKYIRES